MIISHFSEKSKKKPDTPHPRIKIKIIKTVVVRPAIRTMEDESSSIERVKDDFGDIKKTGNCRAFDSFSPLTATPGSRMVAPGAIFS
jgi:hypothetical protein